MITSSSKTSSARSSVVRLAEVERLDLLEQRLLAEVEADHVVDVGVGELVVGDAGAEAVDQLHAARRQDRLEQRAHLVSSSSASVRR